MTNTHSDALRRHELVHKKTKRSSLGRGARACSACAIARRKCSGGNPCEGCEKRSIECTFPPTNRITTNTRRRESNGFTNEPSDEMVGVENNQTGERTTSPQSQISWSRINSPINTQINPHSSIGHYHTGFGMENLDVTGQQMSVQNLSPSVHQQFNSQFTSQNNTMGNSMSGDARRNSTISYDHQSTSSSMLPLHSMMDLDEATNSLLIRTGQASNQLHIPATGLSDGLPESAGSWTQYSLSSINWLPYDWVPDYQIEDDGMRMIDDGTEINGSSPMDTPENPTRSHPTYSMTNATTFTPSPNTHGQIHMDNSPLPTISSEGASASPNSLTTQSTGRYYVDGHGSRLPHIRKAPSETANSCPSISHPTIEDFDGSFAFPPMDDGDGYSYSDYKQIPQEIYNIILDSFEKTCIEDSPFFVPFHHARFPPLHILTMAAVGSHYDRNGHYAKPMHEFLRRAIMSVGIKGDSGCTKVVMVQVKLLNCVGMMYGGCDELSQTAKSYHRDLIDFCSYEWKASNRISRIETVGVQSGPNDTDRAKREWKEWYDAESIRRTGSVLLPCQEVLWEAESAIEWQQLLSCSSTSPTLHNALQRMYTEKRLQSSTGEFSRILLIHGLFRRTWDVETYLHQPLTQWIPTAEKQNLQYLGPHEPVWLPGLQTYARWRNSACDCLDILHWHANSVIGAASGMEHPTVLHLHLARVVLLTPFRQILKFAELLSSNTKSNTHSNPNPNPPNQNPTPTSNLSATDQEKEKEKDILETQNYIKRWATEDQHKARLAIIHAGALFWHVRRFSIDAFYEAEAVYLATLALWAYGLFAEHTLPSSHSRFSASRHRHRHRNLASRSVGDMNQDGDGDGKEKERDNNVHDNDNERLNQKDTHQNTNRDINGRNDEDRGEEEEDDEEQMHEFYPTSMQLDRPADDELVQLFVKRGQGMKALIMGVGNLCGRGRGRRDGDGRGNGRGYAKGAWRVLGEGKEIVGGLGRWGVGVNGKGGLGDRLRRLMEADADAEYGMGA
ncbi:hypothetical protein NHQ30_005532 [Ciborinia camelliae]|nr:hypothetical protein NHQ30_005532 [Ciborinia camelliae]